MKSKLPKTVGTQKKRKENKKTMGTTISSYTYATFLTAVANGEQSAEIQAEAKALLEKHNKAAASRNAKSAEKRATENAPLVEAVTNLLQTNAKVFTAAEVKDAIDGIDSTSKATYILKSIPGLKVSEVVVGNRVVKGYSF